jgi:hypothetical protein
VFCFCHAAAELSAALTVVVPLLVDKGLASGVPEVRHSGAGWKRPPARHACARARVRPAIHRLTLPTPLPPSPQVRGLCVEVLGGVCRTAPAPALRPLLGGLVPALLEALSSLEDVR